jgi:hypothetical protein
MENQSPQERSCPSCGSGEYRFRALKKVPAETAQPGGEALETKFLCKQCGKEWTMRSPGAGGTEA